MAATAVSPLSCVVAVILQKPSEMAVTSPDGLTVAIFVSSELQISDLLFACEGYDPQFGARPVKRVLQRMLLNELSKQIIAGTVNTEKPIRVDAKGDEVVFVND